MALTRKFLSAMGIEAEKIDEIINAHQETLNDIKAERDQYKTDAEKLPGVQKELDDLKDKTTDNAAYKEKYEKEHQDFESYKTSVAEKETKAAKREAYRKLLKESGVAEKFVDAVLKISDIDSVELDDKGAIKDAETRQKAVKDSYPEFIQKEDTKGAQFATPPAGNGSSGERIPSKAAQIAAKYHESLYGKSKED